MDIGNGRKGAAASLLVSGIIVVGALASLGATTVSILLGSFVIRPANAAQPSSVNFTVMITGSGFNDGTLDLKASVGQTVTITFVMDASQVADNSSDNYHVIAIQGYSAKTTRIDPASPRGSLTFVADKAGSYSIYCTSPGCPTHYLMLSGVIEVSAQSVTTAASSTSTSGSTIPITTGTTQDTSTGPPITTTTAAPSTTSTLQTSVVQTSTAQTTNFSQNLSAANLLGWLGLVASAGLLASVLFLSKTSN